MNRTLMKYEDMVSHGCPNISKHELKRYERKCMFFPKTTGYEVATRLDGISGHVGTSEEALKFLRILRLVPLRNEP